MFKYTKTTLEKLETLFKEQAYSVRYEKGSFQSGYAVVEDKKIVVVNKFFDTEGRINALVEILGSIEVEEAVLSDRSLKLYKDILKNTAEEPAD